MSKLISHDVIKFTNSSNYQTSKQTAIAKNVNAGKRAVTADQHLSIFGSTQESPLADPGRRPAITNSVRQDQFNLEAWNADRRDFDKAKDEDNAFKNYIIEMSPVEAIANMSHTVTGLMHLSAKDMLKILDERYGKVTVDTLKSLKKNLPKSCNTSPADLIVAINAFNHLWSTQKMVNAEVPDQTKIELFQEILQPDLDLDIKLWLIKFPDVVNQQWLSFTTMTIAAAETINATRGNNANAAITLPSTPASDEPITKEFLANAIATAIANIHSTKHVRGTNQQQTAAIDPSTLQYCWSHGPNHSHDSNTCKKKHIKHESTATYRNKKGGKSTIWVQGDRLGP